MSIRIDVVLKQVHDFNELGGKYYIAKPMGLKPLRWRIQDAFRVLIGKSRAFHYKEDELNN